MKFRPTLEVLADRITPTTDPYLPTDPTDPPPPPPDFSTIDQGESFYLGLGLTDPWSDPWYGP